MEKYIHPNAIKSSALFRISALIGALSYFLREDHKSVLAAAAMFVTVLLLIGLSFLVRKGYPWVRWVLLILFLPCLVGALIILPSIFISNVIDGWISALQNIIQTIALVLLFIPYNQTIALTEFEIKQ